MVFPLFDGGFLNLVVESLAGTDIEAVLQPGTGEIPVLDPGGWGSVTSPRGLYLKTCMLMRPDRRDYA